MSNTRSLLMGLQTTVSVLPATMTQLHPDAKTIKPTFNHGRDLNKVEMSLLEKSYAQLITVNGDSLTFTSDLYPVELPLELASITSDPVSTGHTSATGAYDHVQKVADNMPLSAFQYFDGVSWWQMLNAVCTSASVTHPAKSTPKIALTYMGGTWSSISAPTYTPAAPAHLPYIWSQCRWYLAGSPIAVVSGSFDIKSTRTAHYTSESGVDPGRFLQGEVEGSGKFLPDYTVYSGSQFAAALLNTATPSIELRCTHTDTVGTGTPAAVTTSLKAYRALYATPTLDTGQDEAQPTIAFTNGVSISNGAGTVISSTNEMASYPLS